MYRSIFKWRTILSPVLFLPPAIMWKSNHLLISAPDRWKVWLCRIPCLGRPCRWYMPEKHAGFPRYIGRKSRLTTWLLPGMWKHRKEVLWRSSAASGFRNMTAGQIQMESHMTVGATGFPGGNGVLTLPAAARISRIPIQEKTVKKKTDGSLPTPVTAAETALWMSAAAWLRPPFSWRLFFTQRKIVKCFLLCGFWLPHGKTQMTQPGSLTALIRKNP